MTNDEAKKLILGAGITLKGEISACDELVVEGQVEVNLTDSRMITVGKSGHFKGKVEVEEAVIAGDFDGNLVARQVLIIKSTGRVKGDIRYGALQVERGGVLTGTVDATDADALVQASRASAEESAGADSDGA